MPIGTAATSKGPAAWPPAPTTFRVLAATAGDPAGAATAGDPAGANPGAGAKPGAMRRREASKDRGERTRATIAQALIDLLSESGDLPTAKEIAARAGVSVRLVFHHFEDLDALYSAVGRTQIDRYWRTIHPVRPDLPLPQRIERTVAQRAALFEAISPVRRRAVALALRHRGVAEALDVTNTMLRTWLEETFAEELRAAERDRRELGAALEAIGSWEMWERLRHVEGLPRAAARRVVVRMLTAILEPSPSRAGGPRSS